MLRRILRILIKLLKWLFLGGILFFALAVIINLHDEPLDEEMRAVIDQPLPAVPDQDNIYVAMAGFTAPSGENIVAVGRGRIDQWNIDNKKDPSGLRRIFDQMKKGPGLVFTSSCSSKAINSCNSTQDDQRYLPCILETQDDIQQCLSENRELLNRYLAIQKMPTYVPQMRVNKELLEGGMPRQSLMQAANLLRQKAMIDLLGKEAKTGLHTLEQDMELWRKALKGKSHLVESMVMVRAMLNDARAVNALLSSEKFDVRSHEKTLRRMLRPLSQEEYSLSQVIDDEIRFFYSIVKDSRRYITYEEIKSRREILEKNNWSTEEYSFTWMEWLRDNLSTPFFHPNASVTLKPEYYKASKELAQLSWCDYTSRREAVMAPFKHYGEFSPSIDWIYNPLGKTMDGIMISTNAFPTYPARMHDLDTYLQLLRVQLEIRLQKTPPEDIPAFLEKPETAALGICSGEQPFSWNGETRTLSFVPHEKMGVTKPEARIP